MNMNTSTAITLNDRFSMIKKQPSNTSIPDARRRSRSRSRSRNGRNQNNNPDLRGSRRNQLLLNRLEQQHKVRLALKLKNKSLMASRGRAQAVNVRNRLRRANVIKKTMNRQRLRRSNSLTTFIPLNDAPSRMRQARSRSRSRSRSRNRVGPMLQNSSSVHDRLGVRQPRRMRRGGQQNNNNNIGQQQRGRSRSRQRLNRNNFRNTVAPTRRSNSVNARLGNNGPVQVQQNQQNRRRRFRSRSRNNVLKNNNGNNNIRNNNRFRNQLNRPMTGRIVKRKINRKTGVNTTQRVRNAAARNVKKMQRGNNNNNNGQARNGRARNRGQRNNQGGQQQQRRGRSRTRRANRGKPQVSKEQLDKQLDAYMAKGSA